MQQLNQSYQSIMMMPIDRFYNCLKWKIKFDEQVQKIQEDELNKFK